MEFCTNENIFSCSTSCTEEEQENCAQFMELRTEFQEYCEVCERETLV